MRQKTRQHILSVLFLLFGFFMILFGLIFKMLDENKIVLLFLIPFVAMIFSLSISIEISLRTPKYDMIMVMILIFLFCSMLVGIGIMIILGSNDINQTGNGALMIGLAIIIFILLTVLQKYRKDKEKSARRRSQRNEK